MISIADPVIESAEKRAVADVLESGQLANGPVVEQFEASFADYCGTDHAVATTNGTTALHTALEALGIGPGDRVLTSPFSFVASANVIRLAGAEVGFVDIVPETYNLDTEELESRLRDGERVDAVIAVHLYGLPVDIDHLLELATEYDFYVVEDAAQAHGATYRGDRVGSFGDAGCFSFYPTKNMTTGEGGMITTDDPEIADRAARFIDHGRTDGYEHADVGHNFRMTDLAAAIGTVQLERLDGYNAARRRNAARLTEGLADEPVETPIEPANRTHVYHQYTVRCADRDALVEHLDGQDIGTGIYYPTTINQQPAYEDVTATVPIAERAADEVVSLPVHPGVTDSDVDRIVDAVATYRGVIQ